MKGLSFLEGMNLTEETFRYKIFGQDKYERARNVLKDIQQIQCDQHVHTRAPPRTVNR